MKKYRLRFLPLSLLISILFLESCVVEAEEIDRQYQLINTSDTSIKIEFYNTYLNTSFEAQIENEGVYLGDILTYRSGNDQWNFPNTPFPSFAFNNTDSLKIIFNDSKFLIYKFTPGDHPYENVFSNPVDRNLFRNGNYEQINKERFQFNITQQDYENAEDCNGDCD